MYLNLCLLYVYLYMETQPFLYYGVEEILRMEANPNLNLSAYWR